MPSQVNPATDSRSLWHAMPPGDLYKAPDAALLAPARSLLDDAWRALLLALQRRQTETSFAPLGAPERVATELARALPLEALKMVQRASIMELHIARYEQRLEGATPEARFAFFEADIQSPAGARRFFDQYPVLETALTTLCRHWVTNSKRLIDRLCADVELLSKQFFGGQHPGALVHIESGLSDRHQQGQTVAILTFQRGAKVLYKPRSLAVDVAFAGMLDWLNERAEGNPPALRIPAVIDRGDYGWAEFIAATACESEQQVRRFYRRQGAHVALLYALEATDFHYENLIAHGETPMLVDLETLLQPVAGSLRLADGDSRPRAFNVLRCGLLPLRIAPDALSIPCDLSGLGGVGNPPMGAREAINVGTDAMAYKSVTVPMPEKPNRPRLRDEDSEHGRSVFVWQYAEQVIAGFDAMGQLLLRHREDFLAKEGPLEVFADLELRHIARDTTIYVRMLEAMRHPDYQQTSEARDGLLDKLDLGAEGFPHFRPLITHERAALAELDVPRFSYTANSRDVIGNNGLVIRDYFEEPALARAQRRIRRLDEDDLERQRWLVRASIEATRPLDLTFNWQSTALPHTRQPFQPARALALAIHAGERLAVLAQRISRDAMSWFHLGFDEQERWQLEPMRQDLYDGLPGVMIFFANLAAVTGRKQFSRCAQDAFETAVLGQAEPAFAWRNIGGFNGLGGWLYTRAHLARLNADSRFLDGYQQEVAVLRNLLGEDNRFDLISGAAGAIAGLLSLHSVTGDAWVLDAAARCGYHLIEHAEQRAEGGIAWPAVNDNAQPLTGFGHGSAGFAWALARLAEATGESTFKESAQQALLYERSFFDPATGTWPDLREVRLSNGERPAFYAWCHGAPGIGLGRVAMLGRMDEQASMLSEIESAVAATLASGFGMNHGLCHGDLGNVELVARAAVALGRADWQQAGKDLAARIVKDIEENGWRTGLGTEVVQPGLMTGLAGIGYGLLRLAHPDRVPSVLTLDLPDESVRLSAVCSPEQRRK